MTNIFKTTILTLIGCALYTATTSADPKTPNQEPNQPDYAKPITPEKLKEDLDFLFKTIKEVHPNIYAYTSKEEFKPIRAELYSRIDRPMNCREFYKLVAPMVSEIKNGHTYMWPFSFGGKDKVFPIALHWDRENAILAADYGANKLPLGGTILAFNGEHASKIIQKFGRYHAAEGKNANLRMVEHHAFLWFWLKLEYGQTNPLVLKIKTLDAKIKDYLVKPKTLQEIYKANPDLNKRRAAFGSYRYIPEYETGLLAISCFTSDAEFRKFLEDTFGKIKKDKVPSLIVDIRKNPGGNSVLGDVLLDYLTDKPFRQFEGGEVKISRQAGNLRQFQREFPDRKLEIGCLVPIEVSFEQPKYNPLRFQGRKFVLIDGRVYSSANSFASAIKCFDIATLIGEETGGTTTCYGDCLHLELPNSGLKFDVAHKYFVEAGGKPDGRGVLPDYEVEQEPEDTAKGVDTVLQFTLNLIKDSKSN